MFVICWGEAAEFFLPGNELKLIVFTQGARERAMGMGGGGQNE